MAPKRPANGVAASSSTKSSSSSTPSSSSAAQAAAATTSAKSTPIAFTAKSPPQDIILGIWQRYLAQTSQRTKLLDVFMGFLVVVGVVQFAYCVLAGNYPFNAFLSGFSAAVGQFVLTASLRMQTSDQRAKNAPISKSSASKATDAAAQGQTSPDGVSPERSVMSCYVLFYSYEIRGIWV
ncbi:oligosaccharyltransferase complex subunit epsilon [Emydomyces testavorans]|uniref:Dolichyl-diphosphooligosaccharide--protein glycosyltransferase subunit OST2 n=1 Tax=Emydomyces testavorans TaxID=2070801 RepID=A0AAF0IJN7_9EURO|nr:oligosaccharyltransferase complex subunit epsilon [Emydomyces testavorans]